MVPTSMGSLAPLVVHVCQIHRQIVDREDPVHHRSEDSHLVAQAHRDHPMSRDPCRDHLAHLSPSDQEDLVHHHLA